MSYTVSKKNIKRDLTNNKTITKISIMSIILILFVLVFITIGTILNSFNNKQVVTINNSKISKNEFMIYVYSAKYNYFKSDVDNITEDDLNVMIDEENKLTVKDYIKDIALNDIKTSIAIKELASKYNIKLSSSDLKELQKEKKSFIKSLGGEKEFAKFLSDNNTNEKAYDEMSKTDKLYKVLLKKIYSKGKMNDLTDKEIKEANKNYDSYYINIKQIILPIIDVTTGKSLSSVIVNGKEALASDVAEKAKSGTDFDDLIRKYSEDAEDKEPPFNSYYKKGELLTELETAALELNEGEVSDPIKTKYAYHIIQRQTLDDSKIEGYYDDLREEKLVNDLKEKIGELKVVYHKLYKEIEVK